MKIGIITLGCKVNTYESNALAQGLEKRGFEVVDASEACDAFIINTCSVTNTADAKSKKMIRHAIKLNPNALICVCGCFSQASPDEVAKIDGVDIIVGNGNKEKLVDLIVENIGKKRESKYIDVIDILHHNLYDTLAINEFDHTRAFIKIEDGCNNFCTYCIIPYARGPIRCKNHNDVIKEIKEVVENGYKEVVLTGIHTGKYNDNGINLSGLVKMILTEVPKLERLRLSSIEINEIDDDFINMMRKSKVLANHLHLPLQAGSDHVLKLMNRRYDKAYFLDKINKIREARPDIAISTDIIVGFPEESEDDFKETLEFSKEINFSKIHVFPYSKRNGTKAALMTQVKDIIKTNRTKELINLSSKLEKNYYVKFLDQELEVIFEQKYNNYLIGHTSNFIQVVVPYDEKYLKKNVMVKLLNYIDGKIIGEIVDYE